MTHVPKFDVFLAHNSNDKPQVRVIASELKRRGLNPWLDEEQIPPGRSFAKAIQQAIGATKTAAVFIGSAGLGDWQILELETFTSRFVKAGIPVIPVLLPGVDAIPDELLFLRQFNWVQFADGVHDTEALYRLEWGITGQRPQRAESRPEPAAEPRLAAEPKPTPKPAPEKPVDDLSSEKGIDYTRLRDLLKAGDWKEADNETYLRMLEAVGREKGDWIRAEELLNFPCADLKTIDRLWVHYSQGHFGFSVQKEIYVACGAKLDGKHPRNKIWEEFCVRIGWKTKEEYISYYQVTFDTSARKGHLPALVVGIRGWLERGSLSESGFAGGARVLGVLFSRIETFKR